MTDISILGVSFDVVNKEEAADRIFAAIKRKSQVPFTVVTPNPIMVMNAQKNKELFSALASADLSLADGIGIVSASKRIGTSLPERVTGIDTAYSVIEKLAEIGEKIYLLGAVPGVAEKAGTGGTQGGSQVGAAPERRNQTRAGILQAPDAATACAEACGGKANAAGAGRPQGSRTPGGQYGGSHPACGDPGAQRCARAAAGECT